MADFFERVNDYYFDETVLKEARSVFLNNKPKSIQLRKFLKPEFYRKIKRSLGRIGWKENVLFDLYNYRTAKAPKELAAFLKSSDFLKFVSIVANKSVKKIRFEVAAFGKADYTLANHALFGKKGAAFLLDFTENWNPNADGYVAFVKNNNELLRIGPFENTLSLVSLEKNTDAFVKYINHLAGNKKRIFVLGTVT